MRAGDEERFMTEAENLGHRRGLLLRLLVTGMVLALCFSGHTAIAVFGALELTRFGRKWITLAAALIVVFEISTVLILRTHYTMDVFAGIVAALSIANLSERISPRLDRLINGGT